MRKLALLEEAEDGAIPLCCLNYRPNLNMASTSPERTPKVDCAQDESPLLSPEASTHRNELSSPLEGSVTDVEDGEENIKLSMEVSN